MTAMWKRLSTLNPDRCPDSDPASDPDPDLILPASRLALIRTHAVSRVLLPCLTAVGMV